jgi:hypothetical protein
MHAGRQVDFLAPMVNYGVGWGRANYHPGKSMGKCVAMVVFASV